MRKLFLAGVALAAALGGCATPDRRESATDPLVIISLEKKSTTLAGDCTVIVAIANRVRDTGWDGASYHLSLLNRKGVSIGRLMGAPRKQVAYGHQLADSGRALSIRCEDIVGAELIYLGYYPTGKAQVHVHNHRVRISVK